MLKQPYGSLKYLTNPFMHLTNRVKMFESLTNRIKFFIWMPASHVDEDHLEVMLNFI